MHVPNKFLCIYSFAETPNLQCRLEISSTPGVIETLMIAMLSPSYTNTYVCSRLIVHTLLCLSFSPETHRYLNKAQTYDAIMKLCKQTELSPTPTSVHSHKIVHQTIIRYQQSYTIIADQASSLRGVACINK